VVPVDDARALADAVQGLLADPARAARLGRAARERVVAGHDAAAMVAGTFHVVRQVAGTGCGALG
jgi:alpha-maltose-1-phosphate synthase